MVLLITTFNRNAATQMKIVGIFPTPG